MANPFQQYVNHGYQLGVQDAQSQFNQQFQQSVAALREEFAARLNQQAGGLRKQFAEKNASVERKLGELMELSRRVSISTGGNGGSSQRDEGNICRPGMVRIEDIPGSRQPYTLLMEIPINRDDMSTREQTYTISADGPFVAVRRMAVFLSAHQFETEDPDSGATAQFSSRSYGRFRPVSSALDILDSSHNATADTSMWWWNQLANAGVAVGSALPSAVLGMPSNISSFRTMEFDGRVEIKVEGSGRPRQNIEVPTAFWSKSINEPWDLGCLDFFERGETITARVRPTHVNNPPAGNVDSPFIFPQTADGLFGWPFLDGQYDPHEGIATPGAATVGDDSPILPNVLTTDSVTRLPDGIFILGFEGYRIYQPMGVVP